MIQLALEMYLIPENIQVMLDDYFSGYRMKFSSISYTTDLINLELGIAMGCIISPILFVMAMEVILKAAKDRAGLANLGGDCYMPPLKAFMDDTTIICSKEEETRRMLERLDILMAWCRMKFKSKKSRSLSVRKGQIYAMTIFTVASQQIPTVSQEPVKSLGRWYDSSMKDTKRGLGTAELANEGLLAINRCGLQGKLKVWCLQSMIIPKLLWPLLVYEICSTTVEAIEAKINKFTRRWLGVPPGLTDVAMYCEDSEDPVVKTVQPTIKTGRKWKVVDAVDEAKECLNIKEVIRQTETDPKGVRSSTAKWWSKAEGKEKRDMVINEMRLNRDSRKGRYTWRHNRVLQQLAAIISKAKGETTLPNTNALIFTTEGGAKSLHGRPYNLCHGDCAEPEGGRTVVQSTAICIIPAALQVSVGTLKCTRVNCRQTGRRQRETTAVQSQAKIMMTHKLRKSLQRSGCSRLSSERLVRQGGHGAAGGTRSSSSYLLQTKIRHKKEINENRYMEFQNIISGRKK
ncbi:hypothetical protein RRG08_060324 [Elysia crispata]|uniref:Reverse transcriptase domain-containing protein n=1 Tax=Elysia crispata TaxID=231223 RepID=A0AAE1ALV4_9GAST|nr:hypothetical protein RRG08_060324 [Elysia crispata]